jgi:hypothetical protein
VGRCVFVLGALLLVSGCGGGGPTDSPSATTKTGTCVQVPAQPLGLKGTTLRGEGDSLAVTWRMTLPVRTWGRVVLRIWATNETDDVNREFAVEFSNGEQRGFHVLDRDDFSQIDLARRAEVVGSEVRAVFPQSEVDPLGSRSIGTRRSRSIMRTLTIAHAASVPSSRAADAYSFTSWRERPRAEDSEARERRPRPSTVLGARWLVGSGRERAAERSRTYVLTSSA